MKIYIIYIYIYILVYVCDVWFVSMPLTVLLVRSLLSRFRLLFHFASVVLLGRGLTFAYKCLLPFSLPIRFRFCFLQRAHYLRDFCINILVEGFRRKSSYIYTHIRSASSSTHYGFHKWAGGQRSSSHICEWKSYPPGRMTCPDRCQSDFILTSDNLIIPTQELD